MKLLKNPIALAALIGVAGMSGCVSGVYLLAGAGWAAISGGVFCMLVSALIVRGVSNG